MTSLENPREPESKEKQFSKTPKLGYPPVIPIPPPLGNAFPMYLLAFSWDLSGIALCKATCKNLELIFRNIQNVHQYCQAVRQPITITKLKPCCSGKFKFPPTDRQTQQQADGHRSKFLKSWPILKIFFFKRTAFLFATIWCNLFSKTQKIKFRTEFNLFLKTKVIFSRC